FPKLTAATSEQIDAYIKLRAEAQKRAAQAEEEAQKVVREAHAKGIKRKKPKVREHGLATDDESILVLARAVGDHRVKSTGKIETRRKD
ncbi:MAG: hypothetical protein LBO00_04010, partial [Zoogloeaceae bacterium]|nr:hypothetical protein [Zoogloeaceae bacterium]